MRFISVLIFVTSLVAAVAGQTQTSRPPIPSETLKPWMVRDRQHPVTRLEVTTPRDIKLVKARLMEQIGPTIPPLALTSGTNSKANYTATVNRHAGPSGFIHFMTILHGKWFRLWGFADGSFVPPEMQLYTIGNPLMLETFARYTIDAFLNAPIRMLVYDTPTGGTTIVWERPCTQLVLSGAPLQAFRNCLLQDESVSVSLGPG
ncbi:hypothetical protein ABW19_dt0207655 [Dactylella cylindrospora]|nr:hypothetical protein ABW19_dt0207655 [Dactylella cylindrospora]